MSGEVLGIETAGHIARTSEVGLGLVSTATIANRGALEFLQQLYTAEDNFVAVWRDVVLQIGGTPKKYATYQTFITRLDNRLNQPLVGTLTGLLPALRAGDLAAAVIMQEEIARQFGVAGASVARGTIQAFLSKSPPGNLTAPQTVRFEFRVRSFTTLADTYTVRILPVNGWPRTVVDSGGTPVPANRIPIGPSGSQTTIFVDVTVQAGQSDLQLEITSDSNPTEVTTVTSLYTLRDGFAAPPGEDKIQLHLTNNHTNAAVDPVTGVVTIRRSQQALVEFRVFNSIGDGQPAQIALQLTRQNVVGTWPVVFDGVAGAGNATSITVNDGGSGPVQLNIQPGNDAVSAQVRVTATAPFANTTVTGEIVIALAATN